MDAQLLPVIVNRSGGTAAREGKALERKLRDAFAAQGTDIDLQLVEGHEIERAVVARAHSDTIVVGGGDGTLGAAARILLKRHKRMAVLPLGTLNHFAGAIGLDGTLEQAAEVAVHGTRQKLDIGLAGSEVFLNNASLGAYARMVRKREASPLPKWLATIPASLGVLMRPGAQHLHIEIDGESKRIKTPLLFVGNNRYSLDAGHIGERGSLTDGLLSLFAVAENSAPGLVGAGLRILRGKADPQSDFAELAECREVMIWRRGHHHIALDGEVVQLTFPLRLSVLPAALEVMVPKAAAM